MRTGPRPLQLLLAPLLVTLAACAPSGGGSSGPPPDAGADPTGTWRVQMLLRGLVGACNGTAVHNVSWDFVPTGPDRWDVHMVDSQNLALGVLQAEQVGVRLDVTGQILGWGGVAVRTYESDQLYATPTSLTGNMNMTNAGSFYCVAWGPLTGVPDIALATHEQDPESPAEYDGVLSVPGLGPRAARLIQVSETSFRLAFSTGAERVLSPAFEAGPDGTLAALLRPRGSDREYALIAQLDSKGRVRGELTSLRTRDGATVWRGTIHLSRKARPE